MKSDEWFLIPLLLVAFAVGLFLIPVAEWVVSLF